METYFVHINNLLPKTSYGAQDMEMQKSDAIVLGGEVWYMNVILYFCTQHDLTLKYFPMFWW